MSIIVFDTEGTKYLQDIYYIFPLVITKDFDTDNNKKDIARLLHTIISARIKNTSLTDLFNYAWPNKTRTIHYGTADPQWRPVIEYLRPVYNPTTSDNT